MYIYNIYIYIYAGYNMYMDTYHMYCDIPMNMSTIMYINLRILYIYDMQYTMYLTCQPHPSPLSKSVCEKPPSSLCRTGSSSYSGPRHRKPRLETPWETCEAMEKIAHLQWIYPSKMVIFHSYGPCIVDLHIEHGDFPQFFEKTFTRGYMW